MITSEAIVRARHSSSARRSLDLAHAQAAGLDPDETARFLERVALYDARTAAREAREAAEEAARAVQARRELLELQAIIGAVDARLAQLAGDLGVST